MRSRRQFNGGYFRFRRNVDDSASSPSIVVLRPMVKIRSDIILVIVLFFILFGLDQQLCWVVDVSVVAAARFAVVIHRDPDHVGLEMPQRHFRLRRRRRRVRGRGIRGRDRALTRVVLSADGFRDGGRRLNGSVFLLIIPQTQILQFILHLNLTHFEGHSGGETQSAAAKTDLGLALGGIFVVVGRKTSPSRHFWPPFQLHPRHETLPFALLLLQMRKHPLEIHDLLRRQRRVTTIPDGIPAAGETAETGDGIPPPFEVDPLIDGDDRVAALDQSGNRGCETAVEFVRRFVRITRGSGISGQRQRHFALFA